MRKLKDNSIDLTVTSPPYDNLRTYNGNNDLWNENVWKGCIKELFRLTKKGGVVVWVVGDATIKGSETGTSFRQALYFKECGFNLHDTMIYKKNNPIPLTHNRYEQSFEYMFIFNIKKLNTFNPIMEICKYKGLKSSRRTQKTNESAKRATNRNILTKNNKIIKNIWNYNIGTKADNGNHPATFPEKLAEDPIISWSNKNDIIFDPFMGSGTTGKMAIKNNRNFIGIELDEEYFEIAKARISY